MWNNDKNAVAKTLSKLFRWLTDNDIISNKKASALTFIDADGFINVICSLSMSVDCLHGAMWSLALPPNSYMMIDWIDLKPGIQERGRFRE